MVRVFYNQKTDELWLLKIVSKHIYLAEFVDRFGHIRRCTALRSVINVKDYLIKIGIL